MPNYRLLFAEAVRDSILDHARDNPHTIPTGWFLGRVRVPGPEVPASIERIDHEPGNPENILDTGPILVANIGWRECDPLDVMVMRQRRAITEAEYRLRMDQLAWDRKHDPAAPAVTPQKRVDLAKLKPIGPRDGG